ncbi:MAG TPA: FecR family protein [Polyangiaceae bacterium]|nr:FecR family protein [Polyangiaceae bacterium]
MATVTASLEGLGARVRAASDQATDVPATLAAARARFLGAVPAARWGRRRAALLGLAAALAAVLALVWVAAGSSWGGAAPLAFTLGLEGRPGVVGDWVSAEGQALDVRFSDGSAVTLAPHSRARVAGTYPYGADLVLEQGVVTAEVVHRARSVWSLRGGPYSVRVTGTRFTLSWDPTAERLELALQEGSVTVSGPHLPEGRAVVAGEHLLVEVRTGEMLLWRADDARAAPSRQKPPDPSPAASAPAAAEGRPSAPAASAPPAASDWRALLGRGDSRGAVAALDRAGVEEAVRSASAAELWQLADAARFAGRPDVATAALSALRSRHGARGSTAFLLGKIAADQRGSPAEAVRWFDAYLAEAPNGPLAEEALGRLMTLQRRSNPAAAAAAAKKYLARYPGGAYSGLARSLRSH